MRHDKKIIGFSNEQGAALIIAMLFLVALGVLSTALIFTVQNEMKTSTAYKYSQQAFYVANAGVQKSVMWFNNSYSPHLPASDYDATNLPVQYSGNSVLLAGQTGSSSAYPEASLTTAFSNEFSNKSLQADATNSGVYALNATLLKYTPASFINVSTFATYPSAVERWRIDALGYWGTTANPMGVAQITAVIENSGNALFDRAIWGIDSVNLSGVVVTDSYDPALGPYGGSNIGNLGSIGSNGSVSMNGNVTINGDLAYGPSGTYSHTGGATVTGQVVHMSEPHYFPPVPSFTVGTTDISLGGNDAQNLAAGSYGSISLGSHSVLTLTGGTYYIDQLSIGSQASLIVSSATKLFVKSALDLGGQGVANATGDPSQFTIIYSGTSAASMTGGSGFYGNIYAPNAAVTLSGNSGFFGSYIGKTVNDSGTPDIHFDEGMLNQDMIQRPFRTITWSQNIY